MISLVFGSNALCIVCLPGVRSGAFEAPIFGAVLFDTFAVSSTRKSPTSAHAESRPTGCSTPRHAVRRGGRPRDVNAREVLNAVFYVLSIGCQRKALPKVCRRRSTTHHYFMLGD